MQIAHNDFQDQLVRGLAHRMNNILSLFHGYLSLVVENEKLDPATLEGLEKIKLGASQASELMDRTQALVRPTASVLRSIDVGEYLRVLRPGFEQFRGPRTEIELEIPEDLPPVHGDVARVRTAIVELVKNACEATFASGGTVRIEVRSEATPNSRTKWLVVSITDDGPGIPLEIQQRVFTPFYSTKKKQNAAGLGLTVAQNFAQQHEGNVKLESEPGRTVAELRLPAQ
jgi:signal transduction histidine kinase